MFGAFAHQRLSHRGVGEDQRCFEFRRVRGIVATAVAAIVSAFLIRRFKFIIASLALDLLLLVLGRRDRNRVSVIRVLGAWRRRVTAVDRVRMRKRRRTGYSELQLG